MIDNNKIIDYIHFEEYLKKLSEEIYKNIKNKLFF